MAKDLNKPKKTLAELAADFKKNPDSFEEFYEASKRYIRYWAKNNQDVIQNSWIRILTGLDTYDPQYPFEPWAQKIVKNTTSDFYARKADSKLKTVNLPPDAVPIENICFDTNPLPDENMVNQELISEIKEVMGTLSQKRQEVFRLKFLGYSFKEISDILDLGSPEVIKNLYFEGLSRLRSLLQEKGIIE